MKNGKCQLLKMVRSCRSHFNTKIKEPGISFQSPALTKEQVRNVSHTVHYYLTKFHFSST